MLAGQRGHGRDSNEQAVGGARSGRKWLSLAGQAQEQVPLPDSRIVAQLGALPALTMKPPRAIPTPPIIRRTRNPVNIA